MFVVFGGGYVDTAAKNPPFVLPNAPFIAQNRTILSRQYKRWLIMTGLEVETNCLIVFPL